MSTERQSYTLELTPGEAGWLSFLASLGGAIVTAVGRGNVEKVEEFVAAVRSVKPAFPIMSNANNSLKQKVVKLPLLSEALRWEAEHGQKEPVDVVA